MATKRAVKTRKKSPTRRTAERSVVNPGFQLDVFWLALLLGGATLIAYFPAIHGSFLWDDDAHVTRPELRSMHGLWRIWFNLGATQQYYPLLHSAFWLEDKLWGEAAVGYHLLNILQHASAAFLLLLILHRLVIPGTFLAAAVFALHPVHVESVAWITEQKNTLSAVFYLGAMLAYLRFDEERRTSLYAPALGLFVLGLLSKTVVATLPGALLVIFWWRRGRLSWQRDYVPLIPWFALGAAAGLLTAWVERRLIGAEGMAFDFTFLQRALLAGRVIWFYLSKLFWPVDLMFIYPRWEVNPALWWHYLFPLGSLALMGWLWLIRHRWRGPLAAMLFFIGSLFPAVSAGIAVALAHLPQRARWAGQAFCILLLGGLAALTWQQSRTYGDPTILYQATLPKNPDCWMCRNNLGILLRNEGQLQAAIEQYEEALRLKPDYVEAHHNLGNALLQAGQLPAAIGRYEQALKINPDYPYAHNNLGRALFQLGKLSEAQKAFEAAVRIKPDYAEAHHNLGNALLQAGQVSEAIGHYQQALKINPDYAEAHYNLGNALLQAGQVSEAIGHYENVLKSNPEHPDVYNNIGGALLMMGRLPEAKKAFEAALRIKPDFGPALENLSLLRAQEQKVEFKK